MGQTGQQVQEHLLKKREAKAEEKQVKKEKNVIDFLMEGERKIAGKTNCL
jgi:hypothetical protein